MQPLYDMMAQNGRAVELMAKQFNLSQQQAALAMEALTPAFSQGLKRSTSDPTGVANFLQALASGDHAKYYDDASNAFSPAGMAEGNGILGHLFGSKDLSRAVASQAAQATGVGQQVLQQMLPAMAAIIMGGLFKQSTNQMPGAQAAAGFGGAGNPLGEIIEQMMKQGGMGATQPRQAQPSASPMDNPFGKVLQDMFGGAAAQPQQPSPGQPMNPMDNPFGKMLQDMFGGAAGRQGTPQAGQNPFGDNPLGKIFGEMLGGQQPDEAQPRPTSQPSPRPHAEPAPKNPYDDIFGRMFETGARQRDEYEKTVGSIFDQFRQGMDRYK